MTLLKLLERIKKFTDEHPEALNMGVGICDARSGIVEAMNSWPHIEVCDDGSAFEEGEKYVCLTVG